MKSQNLLDLVKLGEDSQTQFKEKFTKFYMANGGDVWVKVGADKRRALREELQRLLQESARLYADEQTIEDTGIKDLDILLVNEFIEKRLEEKIGDVDPPLRNILNSMKVLSGENCTLAGLLLFTKKKNLASQCYCSPELFYQ